MPEPVRIGITDKVLNGASSDAVDCGDLLFISAQHGLVDNGSSDPGDPDVQLERALDQLGRVLQDAKSSFNCVAKLNVFYLQSCYADERALLRDIRRRFSATPCAITAIPLHHLPIPGMKVQLDAVASREAGGIRGTSDPELWPWPSHAEFSHAVRCRNIVFVSGQMARDASGSTLCHGDIVGQARATIQNLRTALQGLGADLDSVVKLNTFYVGQGTVRDWEQAARIRSDSFVKPGPGATGVPIPGPYPDGVLIRQDCMAILGSDGKAAPRETSWPEGHWDWPIPVSFEQGLKLGDIIVLGGQVAADMSGKAIHSGDLVAQTADCMDNIERILGGFEASLSDLVKVTVLYSTLGDPEDLRSILAVLRRYFPQQLPAFTAIPLNKLGFEDILIEIEGIGIV